MSTAAIKNRKPRASAGRRLAATKVKSLKTVASTVEDWIFDRHDLRHGQGLHPASEDFKAHLLNLGEVKLDWPRVWKHRKPID